MLGARPSDEQTIAARINLLAGFLLLALVTVSLQGWYSLRTNAGASAAAARTNASYEQSVNAARVAQVSFKIQVQEWKNILLRGRDPQAFDNHSRGFQEMAAAAERALAELERMEAESGFDTEPLRALRAAHAELGERYASALKLYDASAEDGALVVDRKVKGLDRSLNEKLDRVVESTRERMVKLRALTEQEAQSRLTTSTVFLACAVLLAVALGVTATFVIRRSIVEPLTRTIGYFKSISRGKFDNDIRIANDDEIGEVLSELRAMQSKLGADVEAVNRLARQVADVVRGAARGDFGSRIAESETGGVFDELGRNVNQLMTTTDGALAELARVLSPRSRTVTSRSASPRTTQERSAN